MSIYNVMFHITVVDCNYEDHYQKEPAKELIYISKSGTVQTALSFIPTVEMRLGTTRVLSVCWKGYDAFDVYLASVECATYNFPLAGHQQRLALKPDEFTKGYSDLSPITRYHENLDHAICHVENTIPLSDAIRKQWKWKISHDEE